jgi:hypothetical protein
LCLIFANLCYTFIKVMGFKIWKTAAYILRYFNFYLQGLILAVIMLVGCSSLEMYAQAPLRIEINIDKKDSIYSLIPVSSNGLMLIGEPVLKKGPNSRNVSFSKYNTDLNYIWSGMLEIPVPLTLSSHFMDTLGNNLYLLYTQKSDFTENKVYYKIVKIDLKNNSLTTKSGHVDENLTVTEFTVIDNSCIWGGNTTSLKKSSKGCFLSFKGSAFKAKPLIFITDFITNETQKISFNDLCVVGTLLNISDDRSSKTFSTIVALKKKKSSDHIFDMVEYSLKGEIVNILAITTGNQFGFLETAKIIALQGKDKMILGTYSLRKNSNKNADASTNTQGYYIIKISNNTQEFYKQYSFNEFTNFYNYLNYKTKNKIIKRNNKSKSKGGETELNYQLLVHEVFIYNGNYILASEAYYPEYHTEYYTTYYNGYPQTTTYSVFDGYRYTHAIVAAFDKNGALMWDNTMQIWDILSFNLKNRISFVVDKENNMVVLYNYNGTLFSKQINGNITIEEKDRTPIETSYPEDKVKGNSSSDIDYWYGNYFIAYGIQEVRNPDQNPTHKTTRNVFYFNKIGFE